MQELYGRLSSLQNLFLAYKKARKGKIKKRYVKRFEKNLTKNLTKLKKELLFQTYKQCPLKTFIIRDPKTRKISKSAFRDRIIHHALINTIGPIFEKSFIYDSHANQIRKGTHKAIERFDQFKRKVSRNNTRNCFVLKADIKHYFQEVNHEILLKIIKRKIKDEKVIWLIEKILKNCTNPEIQREKERDASKVIHYLNNDYLGKKGMPLGNLTSQFFANIYLNKLDYFVKHKLKAKYYIRYVDDFVILHHSREQLEKWKFVIDGFLKENLDLELHPNKSKIHNLKKGVNFLGFRIFYYYKLLKKSNIKNFERKFNRLKIIFNHNLITREMAIESFDGWLTHASNANTFKFRKHIIMNFNKIFPITKITKTRNCKKHNNFIKKIKESELQFSSQKTLFLFNRGFSIREVAEKNIIKESTVWSHLANLIEYNHLSVFEVLPRNKVHNVLYSIYSKNDTLKSIKQRLNDDSITYNEINCVLASVKRKISDNKPL